MTTTAFETAIKLTEAIYTHAVIHCVAERADAVWHNLYTSAIYGRETDLLSVPAHVEYAEYGTQLVCLRVRVTREEAKRLLSDAKSGSALYHSWDIRYAIDEVIEGFRPAGRFTDLSDPSFWERSLWCRENISSRKTFDGEALGCRNSWRVAEYLECLEEPRWSPIPLAWHPEKIGDLDEIYPSPISVEIGNDDGSSTLGVASIDPSLLCHEIVTTGTLIHDDLIVRALYLVGKGPLRFEEEFNGVSVLTTVDGIPMEAWANWYIRSISMNMTIFGNARMCIPADGRRKELAFPIPHRQPERDFIGAPKQSRVRHQAWTIGRLFRSHVEPSDSEHFYNPVVDPEASVRAFHDLQQYGKEQQAPEIVVADPYAVDERAMYALAMMALREHYVPRIDVLTQFNSGTSEAATTSSVTTEELQGQDARSNQRALTEQRAKAVAQKIATELNVRMSFYRIESLHDRFLLVGDRLWHVGCSFNQLGQEITAIVEMRDERVKHSVMETFDAVRKQPPVFEVQP